jgi:hypothetical protein
MPESYIVTGTITDSHTVILEEELPVGPTRVRLVVEPLEPRMESPRSYHGVMAEVRDRPRLRGHQPPTPEEVYVWLQAERDGWW